MAMAAGAASLLSLGGCATIVDGTHQVLHIKAVNGQTHQAIPNAKCKVTNAKNIGFVVPTNPGSVRVPRDYGGLTIACSAKGFYQQSIGTSSSFNSWVLGDILFWPGAIVDLATGAAKQYPPYITVFMVNHHVKNEGYGDIITPMPAMA